MRTSDNIRQPHRAIWVGNNIDNSPDLPDYGTEGFAYLETNQRYARKQYSQLSGSNIDQIIQKEEIIWCFDWIEIDQNRSIYTTLDNIELISKLEME